jgi:DNA-binding MarR family transcriptional regulator
MAEGALRRHLVASLDAAGVSFEQWQVMAVLLERPGLPMTALADAAVLPAATLTRHVDRLVQRALVIRRIDQHDRRRAVVALSPSGERIAGDLRNAERTLESGMAHVHVRP